MGNSFMYFIFCFSELCHPLPSCLQPSWEGSTLLMQQVFLLFSNNQSIHLIDGESQKPVPKSVLLCIEERTCFVGHSLSAIAKTSTITGCIKNREIHCCRSSTGLGSKSTRFCMLSQKELTLCKHGASVSMDLGPVVLPHCRSWTCRSAFLLSSNRNYSCAPVTIRGPSEGQGGCAQLPWHSGELLSPPEGLLSVGGAAHGLPCSQKGLWTQLKHRSGHDQRI